MSKKAKPVFVSPDKKSGTWKVKQDGDNLSTHRTQSNAIKAAKSQAERQETELRIQGRNGQIRDTRSYGNDDCPPVDKDHK